MGAGERSITLSTCAKLTNFLKKESIKMFEKGGTNQKEY